MAREMLFLTMAHAKLQESNILVMTTNTLLTTADLLKMPKALVAFQGQHSHQNLRDIAGVAAKHLLEPVFAFHGGISNLVLHL